MFNVEGDVLNIDINMSFDDISEFKSYISERLDYIEEIGITNPQNQIPSSALIQLLYSIKLTKPNIKIAIFDSDYSLEKFGKFNWIKS